LLATGKVIGETRRLTQEFLKNVILV